MYKLYPTLVVAFMGVDGSGKSTLIKHLSKRLKKRYRTNKYLHLRPYLFLTDTSNVNSNPHDQKKKRSFFLSLIKILMWLFIYHVFFLINLNKKNLLIIFDRYAHDLLIDKTRYRFSLSNMLTQYILNLFPKPHFWIVLKAPIKKIEKRKKEMPTHELKRQMKEYKNFSKNNDNVIIVDTSNKINENISLIVSKMKSTVN